MYETVKNLMFTIAIVCSAASVHAQSMPTNYTLTITNGSSMPISPVVVYSQNGQTAKSKVGTFASMGFVQLCQSGNAMARLQELNMMMGVTFKTQTSGPILPGESRTIEVEVKDPLQQSIQFETMYGKSKDVCAVASINGHSLYALKQHVTSSVIGRDSVVQTGVFSDPALPSGHTYLDPQVCSTIGDATTCLRNLSSPKMNMGKIRFFSGYLPSVSMLLEARYGAEEVLNLAIPTSGSIQYEIKLK